MKRIYFTFALSLLTFFLSAQLSQTTIDRITSEINKVRRSGLKCGNQKMPSVHPIHWYEDLYEVSLDYATYMKTHRHFAHLSKEGEDAGMRLDKIGYNWRFVGENIAMGQHDFPEVLRDWIKSPSHCKMLMSKDMHHFAVARDGKYWVQTFATPMRR